jgi:hypothetical protein
MKKINLFDILVLSIVVIFFFVLFLGAVKRNSFLTDGYDIYATVRVIDEASIVYNAAKDSNYAFLNSINTPSEIVEVERSADLESNYTYITLHGTGVVEENIYIFNGTRILINQKAEIHGSFFGQGIIYEVSTTRN